MQLSDIPRMQLMREMGLMEVNISKAIMEEKGTMINIVVLLFCHYACSIDRCIK